MQNQEFQTKSLESLLEHYTITEDGELFVTQSEREWVEDSSSVLGGYAKVLRTWEERIENCHGDIYFYTFRVKDVPKDLVTFRARFTHGKLESIIVTSERESTSRIRPVPRS